MLDGIDDIRFKRTAISIFLR